MPLTPYSESAKKKAQAIMAQMPQQPISEELIDRLLDAVTHDLAVAAKAEHDASTTTLAEAATLAAANADRLARTEICLHQLVEAVAAMRVAHDDLVRALQTRGTGS